MFPFHTLALPLWLTVMDLCLNPSENAPRKCLTFKKDMALCEMVASVCFCDLFWNPSCTNLIKVKSPVNCVMGRTMTNVQIMGHFINQHLSIIQNHGKDLFNVFISTGCAQVSRSFIISDTSVTILKHGKPFTHYSSEQYCSHTVLKLYG
jgi:hypothetical protein